MKPTIRHELIAAVLGTVIGFFAASQAFAQVESPSRSLEDQLKELELPGNRAPQAVSQEKLYSVENRFVPLKGRHELDLSVAKNFTPDSFLVSQEVGGSYRYHLNHRWSLNASGAFYFNRLTSGGMNLLETKGLVPDLAYAKNRAELGVAYNAFYGKFRASMERVFHFDQYFALSAGLVELSTGRVAAGSAEAGFAFWAGRSLGLRLGVKDLIYNERRLLSESLSQNVIAQLSLSVLLGGGQE